VNGGVARVRDGQALRIVFRAPMPDIPAESAARRASDRRPRSPGGAALVRARGVSTALALAVLALVADGCSVKGGDNPNLILGKQTFVAKCGVCHVLARANTKGNVGPSLDAAFERGLAEGEGRTALRGVVEMQIKNPNPEGAMPKDLVSGALARDVASYVEESAAKPGKDTGLLASAVAAPGAGKPAVEKAGKLEIDANPEGQLAYQSTAATATAGPVTVSMANVSGVSHNIAVEPGAGGATAKGTALAASSFISKGTTSITLNLKPGTYTFFCQVPGHRAAGMFGTLTVK
jgi:plastocyanin